MKEYIDKAAVVAEINRVLNSYDPNEITSGRYALVRLRDFLDTLEVKEVHDIWHDVSEKPELEQPLLIIMKGTHKDFRRHYRIGCYGKRANDIPTWVIAGCYSDSFISKWCYISDILQYTSEAKEVDLKAELNTWRHNHFHGGRDFEASGEYLERITQLELAKHFFEIGLNAQRKISYVPNIDDSLKELGVDPDSKEAKIFKESYYTALEKLKAQKGE